MGIEASIPDTYSPEHPLLSHSPILLTPSSPHLPWSLFRSSCVLLWAHRRVFGLGTQMALPAFTEEP